MVQWGERRNASDSKTAAIRKNGGRFPIGELGGAKRCFVWLLPAFDDLPKFADHACRQRTVRLA